MKKNLIAKVLIMIFLANLFLLILSYKPVEASVKKYQSMEAPKDTTFSMNSVEKFLDTDAKIMKYDSRTGETTEVNKDELRKELLSKNILNQNDEFTTIPGYFPDGNTSSSNLNTQIFPRASASSALKVTDTSVDRYRGTCRIEANSTSSNEMMIGSGFLVGPNLALTAAHCVFDGDNNNAIYPNWNIYAAYNNGHIYGDADVCGWKQVYFYDAWKQTHNSDYDIALCVLYENIGDQVGYYGLRVYSSDSALNGTAVSLQGYPANTDEGFSKGGYDQYVSSGYVTSVSTLSFTGDFYTTKGFSGGPVLPQSNPYVALGVEVGQNKLFKTPYSVRISQNLSDLVVSLRQQ